jgi:hypothetical protein
MATTRQPYSYVSDNPLNGIDPTGLCGWTDPASCAVDAGIWIGQQLPGETQQAYVAGLSGAANWVGTTSDQLNSGDPGQEAQGVLSSVMLAGMLVPGEGEAVAGGDEALNALRFSGDQDAIIQLGRDALQRCGGVTSDEAQNLLDWADEYGLPNSGQIESHIGRAFGQFPHIRVGPLRHLWIR